MTHFGNLPTFPGHLNPMAALGRELQRGHHRITFVQIPDFEPLVRSQKLNFWPIGQSTYRPGELAGVCTAWEIERSRSATLFSRPLPCDCMICQDAPGAIKAAGIEALLVDQTSAGDTVAQFLGIPFITVCCALAINRETQLPCYSLGPRMPGGRVFAIRLHTYWIAIQPIQQVQ